MYMHIGGKLHHASVTRALSGFSFRVYEFMSRTTLTYCKRLRDRVLHVSTLASLKTMWNNTVRRDDGTRMEIFSVGAYVIERTGKGRATSLICTDRVRTVIRLLTIDFWRLIKCVFIVVCNEYAYGDLYT